MFPKTMLLYIEKKTYLLVRISKETCWSSKKVECVLLVYNTIESNSCVCLQGINAIIHMRAHVLFMLFLFC